MTSKRTAIILIFSLITAPLIALAAQDAGESVSRRGTVNDDYYAAGGTVNVDAEIKGDVVIAGGTLTVANRISQDAIMAGGTLTLRGDVADDVRVAGGTITVDARIGDDLMAAGGTIDITSNATVGGNAMLAGGEVHMAGTIDGDLMLGGGEVVISGTVRGNVKIEGAEVQITDGARIDGNVEYKSPEKADINSGAIIKGKVTYTESEQYQRPHRGWRLISVITMSVAGIVLLLVFPNFTQASSGRMASHFWKHLGLGFALLVATPVAAVLMMATVAGIWVGMPLMAVYFVSLLVAFLVGAFFIAWRGAGWVHFSIGTRGRQVVALIAAILALTLLRFIPVLGGVIVFIILTTALGATVLQVHDVYRGGKNVVPASGNRLKKVSKKKTRRK